MLKLQGTVLGIGTPQDIIPAPEVIQVDLSLFLVDRTRIKNVLLSSFPSFLVIFQNAENILGFLLNSPRPHLKHNKSLGAQDFHQAWTGRPQARAKLNLLPLSSPHLVDLLRCCCDCGSDFLSSPTQLGTADITPQFLLWSVTCSNVVILWVHGVFGS